jgi:hypothetical protein
MILRREMMKVLSFVKLHWGSIAGIAVPVLAFLKPSFDSYISLHPHAALSVIGAALLTTYNWPSPWTKRGAGN